MRLSKLSEESEVNPAFPPSNGVKTDGFWLFESPDLVPGRKLLGNSSLSFISLLPGEDDPVEYALA